MRGQTWLTRPIKPWSALIERPEDATFLTDRERGALAEDAREEGRQAHTIGGALKSARIWLLAVVYFTIPVAARWC